MRAPWGALSGNDCGGSGICEHGRRRSQRMTCSKIMLVVAEVVEDGDSDEHTWLDPLFRAVCGKTLNHLDVAHSR